MINQINYCTKEEFISSLSEGVKYHEGILRMPRVPKDFTKDKDCALAAVKNNGFNLKNVSKELKEDFDVVKAAVIENDMALEFAPNLQANEELMFEIVRAGGKLYYMSIDLLQNVAFLEKVIEINPYLYDLVFGENHKYIPKRLKGLKKMDFTFEEADMFINILKEFPLEG